MLMRGFHCAFAKINPFDDTVHSYGVANSLRPIPKRKYGHWKKVPFRLRSRLFGTESQLLIWKLFLRPFFLLELAFKCYQHWVYKPPRLNMELDFQSVFGLHVHSCTHWLRPRNPPPSPRIWAHIRGRYWSAKIDDISLWPPDKLLSWQRKKI